MERLDKLICSQGMRSRREIGGVIRRGGVTVNGAVCRDPARKVDPAADLVTVEGEALRFSAFVYYMLNKPAGLLCVSRDPRAETVVDLLRPEDRRRGIFPAGRLDRDTRGLVLLTDDGDLAHRLLSPKKHIEKRYRAILDGSVDKRAVEAFAAGVVLADGTRCRPAGLCILQEGERPLVEITLCEGKYHQIKRMFGTLDRGVDWLKRVSMGGLMLDETLKEGEYRSLGKQEISLLFKEC